MSRTADSGYAAVLSLILPGVGQFYAGRFGWGIFWLIVTPGFWVGTGGCLGWICHIVSAIQAWNQTKQRTTS